MNLKKLKKIKKEQEIALISAGKLLEQAIQEAEIFNEQVEKAKQYYVLSEIQLKKTIKQLNKAQLLHIAHKKASKKSAQRRAKKKNVR